jgi:hypothetical protein
VHMELRAHTSEEGTPSMQRSSKQIGGSHSLSRVSMHVHKFHSGLFVCLLKRIKRELKGGYGKRVSW